MATRNKGCVTFGPIANLARFSNSSALYTTSLCILTGSAIGLHERVLWRIAIIVHSNDITADGGRLMIHDLWTRSIFLSSLKVLGLSSPIWNCVLLPSTWSLHRTVHWLIIRLVSHSNRCPCLALTKIVNVVWECLILVWHLILHRSRVLITSVSTLNEVRLNHLLILNLTLHLTLLNNLSWDLLLCICCASIVRTLCIWRCLIWPVLDSLDVPSIWWAAILLLGWTLIVVVCIVLILLILCRCVLHRRSRHVILFFFFLILELSNEAVSSLTSCSSLVHILICNFSVDDWHVS